MIGAITAGLFSTGTAASTNSYESIATVTVGSGGSSSISFSSIPSTYKHLQIRCLTQDNRATFGMSGFDIKFNSDSTATNYAYHLLNGDGSVAGAGGAANTLIHVYDSTGTTTGGSFGATIIDVLDYQSTNKNKTVRSLGGIDFNGVIAGYGGRVTMISGLWMNSSTAISSIQIVPNLGTSFNQYSSFALYGIKG